MPFSGDIFYQLSKQGEEGSTPLVLVHGAGGDHMHWDSQIRKMVGVNVYALDLLGHGQSLGGGKQSVNQYCEEVANWQDRMGFEKVFIAGHSMGGAIAQTFALNYSEKLSALILISTGMKLPVNSELLKQLGDPKSIADAIKLTLKWSFMKDVDPELLLSAEKQLLSVKPGVIHGDYLACNQFDISENISELDLPILIICGESDRMTPVEYCKQLHSAIKGSKMVVIPGAGHMVILEKPEAVQDAIRNFLKQ